MKEGNIEFSENYYRRLLECIKKGGGYKFSDFLGNNNGSGLFFLRHDIDKSVETALKIARIENEFDVHAHYFFLLNSPLYNLLEPETHDMVNEIHQLGHSIGLHCDERRIPESTGDFDKDVMKCVFWIKSLFGFAKPIVSFHNPSNIPIKRKPLMNYFSTYDPDYFPPKMKYISDSNRLFREGDPLDGLIRQEYPRVQMLIHPIWWFDKEKTTEHILKNVIKKRFEYLDSYLKYSNDIWKEYRKDKSFL